MELEWSTSTSKIHNAKLDKIMWPDKWVKLNLDYSLELQCHLDCDLDLSLLSWSSWQCLELDLVWQFLCILWCCAVVGLKMVFLGQSMTICLYSSQSWHLLWEQCHCDVSWFLALKTSISLVWHHVDHWRWEDVVVSYCAALSFSTSVMVSFSACGSFS